MVTINEKELLTKLNRLLDIEVEELQKYSTTSACSQAKEGMEKQYDRHKHKARLISEIKYHIYFAAFFNCGEKQINKKNSKQNGGKQKLKSTGIVRKMDDLGRIVIPKEIRRTFEIDNDDPVEIFTDGDLVILKKYREICIFCGSKENLELCHDKSVCPECLEKLRNRK